MKKRKEIVHNCDLFKINKFYNKIRQTQLDPDPQKINADPQHSRILLILFFK